MTNPLHLELLRGGTETWNNWMNSNPSMFADFERSPSQHLQLRQMPISSVATLSEPN